MTGKELACAGLACRRFCDWMADVPWPVSFFLHTWFALRSL